MDEKEKDLEDIVEIDLNCYIEMLQRFYSIYVHIYIHTHTYIRTRKVYSYRERARDAKQGMFTRQRGKGPSSSRCVVLGPTTGRNESKPG